MATIAICIVNVMRLQKPSPKDFVTAAGVAPLSRAAPATNATARQTNTNASGNQRSAQLVKLNPTRASAASPDGPLVLVKTAFPWVVMGSLLSRLARFVILALRG